MKEDVSLHVMAIPSLLWQTAADADANVYRHS